MKHNYKFDYELGVLECDIYSVRVDELEESEKNEEITGRKDKIYGQSTPFVADFHTLGGIAFFNPNPVEIDEEDNWREGTFVETGNGQTIILLIPFPQFKELYYRWMHYKPVKKLTFCERFLNFFKRK